MIIKIDSCNISDERNKHIYDVLTMATSETESVIYELDTSDKLQEWQIFCAFRCDCEKVLENLYDIIMNPQEKHHNISEKDFTISLEYDIIDSTYKKYMDFERRLHLKKINDLSNIINILAEQNVEVENDINSIKKILLTDLLSCQSVLMSIISELVSKNIIDKNFINRNLKTETLH